MQMSIGGSDHFLSITAYLLKLSNNKNLDFFP